MSGHTPGPWMWLGEPGRSVLNAAKEKVFDYAGYENLWPGSYDDATDLANAHLIAAAPELLEALKAHLDEHLCKPGYCPACGMARDAIAKAEGRS